MTREAQKRRAYESWLEDNLVQSANEEIEEVLARDEWHRVEKTDDPDFDTDAYLDSLAIADRFRRMEKEQRMGANIDSWTGNRSGY